MAALCADHWGANSAPSDHFAGLGTLAYLECAREGAVVWGWKSPIEVPAQSPAIPLWDLEDEVPQKLKLN